MKRYLFWFAIPLVLTVSVGAALFVSAAGHPDNKYHATCALMVRKTEIAHTIEGRKILIVAGSNAHYGMRAGDLVAATGLPTVNLGLRAGIGLDYLLYVAKRLLRPGDIAILPLEFTSYTAEPTINRISASVSLCEGLDYFRTLSLPDKIRYLRALPRSRLVWGVRAHLPARQLADDPAAGLTRWGDETRNLPNAETRARLAAFLASPGPTPVFDGKSEQIESLSRFFAWARLNDVRVYAAWPNFMDYPAFRGPAFEALAARIRTFYREHNIPLIGDVEDGRLPPELMYDSEYHPSREGTRRRMTRFLAAFCAKTDMCNPHLRSAVPEP